MPGKFNENEGVLDLSQIAVKRISTVKQNRTLMLS